MRLSEGDVMTRRKGGRPHARVNVEDLRTLRASGMSWRGIGRALGIGASTALHLCRSEMAPEMARKGVQKPRRDVLRDKQVLDSSGHLLSTCMRDVLARREE